MPGAASFEQLSRQSFPRNFVVVPYVDRLSQQFPQTVIYLHPRREGYSPEDVRIYLANSPASVVVIDTFAKFEWNPEQYFALVNSCREKVFLLAHGGGYDVREFVQIVRYTENCYIDFSATQEIFGCVTDDRDLNAGVRDVIVHALAEPRLRSKVVFGSDNPEFSQEKAMAWYSGLNSRLPDTFDDNFKRMMSSTGFCV